MQTRLGQWLIQHCPNPGSVKPQSIRLPATKRLLASELGTSSETFSRPLTKLRNQRLLSMDGKTVTVLCPSR